MAVKGLVYGVYRRRLRRQLVGKPRPGHVGLVMDGNRRWARGQGHSNPSVGHRYGAMHVEKVLGWCEAAGVQHVTVYLCSTENLVKRGSAEVAYLMQVTEEIVTERLNRPDARWQVHVAGQLDLLPDTTSTALKAAVEATETVSTGNHLTLAIGYGGRQEVVEAVRALLETEAGAGKDLDTVADSLQAEDIARHLFTAGQPDPDLIIRTSGEQRMSNFLLWQSAHSELWFCDAYWPAFREIDFLRALRSYADRKTAS
ncbi:undecaprenyl pyrophosphate synthetase [Kribbella amoyensis]|uniref:Isoprenyl transferase n=1 Tax=Kribbella amoyensis TaxID=996641 RepID=A0A561BM63_9ACTN|nr:polyprenyl diphosphate synthase [Kribbella amoyensis]TWD79986.1 undecaprenyl pyrophosphate synthetase [Kribbella amoyensis]